MNLRFVRPGDAEDLVRIYAPYVGSTAVSFETVPPDAAEFERRIEAVASVYPWLVAEEEGRVIGYAYAAKHKERAAYRFSVDFAVYVAGGFQGRGFGKALYGRLIDNVRELGYYNAFGVVTLPNERSAALHEAFGFKLIGVFEKAGYKLGAWRDVGWWQLRLREPDAEPREPVAVKEIFSRIEDVQGR